MKKADFAHFGATPSTVAYVLTTKPTTLSFGLKKLILQTLAQNHRQSPMFWPQNQQNSVLDEKSWFCKLWRKTIDSCLCFDNKTNKTQFWMKKVDFANFSAKPSTVAYVLTTKPTKLSFEWKKLILQTLAQNHRQSPMYWQQNQQNLVLDEKSWFCRL